MNYKLPVCRWTIFRKVTHDHSQNTVQFFSEIYRFSAILSFIIGNRIIKLCSYGVDWFQESNQQNPR